MKETFLKWLNLALMLDLFFVLFSFFWLVVAVIGDANHLTLGLQVWRSLWDPVMQPAIGILMAGAIVSGISSWVSKKLAGN